MTTVMTWRTVPGVSYRPPAAPPRGRWARFLHQMRKDRDWSQQQGFEALREGLHFGPKSRASYIAIDMGHRIPTTAEAAYLVKFFGQSPDDIPEVEEPEDQGAALIAALTAQTAAISAMAGSGTGATPSLELAALLEAQTAALDRQTAAFLTLAASIDRATGHVIQRIDDVEDALVDLGEALRTPATSENGGVGDDAHAPSGGRL